MDTYSYISENGTVRQIEDLLAKAKNEEQDVRLRTLENQVLPKSWKKVWEGSVQVPTVDGLTTEIARIPEIIGKEKIAIVLSNTYASRLPDAYILERFGSYGSNFKIFGNFSTTPPYTVQAEFRVSFTTGAVYGSFSTSSWTFTAPSMTSVYVYE